MIDKFNNFHKKLHHTYTLQHQYGELYLVVNKDNKNDQIARISRNTNGLYVCEGMGIASKINITEQDCFINEYKIFNHFIDHLIFQFLRSSQKTKNKIPTPTMANMNELNNKYLTAFHERFDHTCFVENDGYHTKVPFGLIVDNMLFFHIDSHFNEHGITRFQGVISGFPTGYPPISLMPLIANYQVATIYKGSGCADDLVCWTIWFKEPITQEKWNFYNKYDF